MRRGRPVEREVGMEFYASESPGTGGHLRDSPADFRVRELERFDTQPLDADPGAYPHLVFRATLTGWDTNDFASALSDRLGISRERVSWAGTKDKYAVTTQLFTVKDVDLEELPALSEAEVEVVGRAGRNLHFGDLAGNAFELVVTDPDEPENVTAVDEELRAFGGSEVRPEGEPRKESGEERSDDPRASSPVGVPNYFGQQRFGSQRAITHEVGLEIARGNWEDAVLAYVGNPSEREREDSRTAREYAEETRDWEGTLERMPGRLRYERSILHRLVEDGGEDPEDFRAALETFPSNLQRLLVNAAQSYAFNLMLAERLERGLPFDRALAGDVVCFSDTDAPEGLVLPDTDRLQRVTGNRVETINRHCARGRAFVTAPLVGTETDLADGEQGDIERAVLDELDIDPADFDLPGEFHSKGTRRAILLRTDVDVERDPLTFSFALPKGSYATVVMREYMKVGPEDLS